MAKPRIFPTFALVAGVWLSACTDLVPVDTTEGVTRTAQSGASTTTQAPPAGTNPSGTEVVLLAVLDGDSLAVDIDGQREEVRLVGINTPEADECYGEEAKSALEAVLGGGTLVLVPVDGEDDRDRFGRLLRDVWADGVWLNELQVASGLAVALQSGSPGEPTLIDAEDAAFGASLGMWAFDACGPEPSEAELLVRVGDIRFDPPGRDFENAEEEFVSIVNEAETAIDIGGWIIRDESSQHRYVFPFIEIASGEALRIRSGCGEDEGRDLYWCAGDAVWSNGGDTVLLQTDQGVVIDRFKYEGDF